MADAALEALLQVQAHDLVIDQLRHRRATLAERKSLRELAQERDDLDRRLAEVVASAHDLDRRQRRLQDEVDALATKRSLSQERLYGGSVQAPRELQALAQEIELLARRVRELEDEQLELMEAAAPLEHERSSMEAQRRALETEGTCLAGVVAELEAGIDTSLASEASLRAQAAASAPADLLASYEQLRRRLDGVAVARLDGGRCTGCHLRLPAVELDAIRRAPVGTVVRHEECGRILVP